MVSFLIFFVDDYSAAGVTGGVLRADFALSMAVLLRVLISAAVSLTYVEY